MLCLQNHDFPHVFPTFSPVNSTSWRRGSRGHGGRGGVAGQRPGAAAPGGGQGEEGAKRNLGGREGW